MDPVLPLDTCVYKLHVEVGREDEGEEGHCGGPDKVQDCPETRDSLSNE